MSPSGSPIFPERGIPFPDNRIPLWFLLQNHYKTGKGQVLKTLSAAVFG
jgi:hypothetical protein